MIDSQLTAILTAILDILTAMNTAYADDRGQTNAIERYVLRRACDELARLIGGETK